MSKVNDGGPAFPCSNEQLNSGHAAQGMTLRDWVAGQAMAAIISKMPLHGCNHSAGVDHIPATDAAREQIEADIAQGAYNYADAMLAARQSQEGDDA